MNETSIMRRVIELARQGSEAGQGGPFGCVIVKDGEMVAEAHNEVLASKDPTAHAELLAIRRAAAALGSYDLSGCDLYTIGAPCCMCASSMLWARIRRSIYCVPMADSTAVGLGDDDFYAELALPLSQRTIVPMIQEPELSDEARAVYRNWFKNPDRIDF
jgi:guanine deaminase